MPAYPSLSLPCLHYPYLSDVPTYHLQLPSQPCPYPPSFVSLPPLPFMNDWALDKTGGPAVVG